jgi:hypothetical protein
MWTDADNLLTDADDLLTGADGGVRAQVRTS